MAEDLNLEPLASKPGARAFLAFLRCYEEGALVRTTSDASALAPARIPERSQIDRRVDTLRSVLADAH